MIARKSTGSPAPAPGKTRTRRVRAAALALAASALTLLPATAATAATSRAATANPSGLAWLSGAYTDAGTPAAAASFGTWRGRPLDVVDVWSARATWADITSPTWLYQEYEGTPYTLALGVAMLPEGVSGVSLAACANGSYNSYWAKFGSVISSYKLGSSIIRLGWEFNGDWYAWSAYNPATYAACWRNVVTAAHGTAPGLRFDWNVNRGVSAGLADPTKAYPGDAYVSMIGVDSYDDWPAATTAAGWQTQLNGTQGLNYWLAFAKAHGKKLSVPEWGNITATSSDGDSGAGGDDPAYVQDMKSFFTANAASIAFEANFQGDSSSTGGVYGSGTAIPRASAAYKAAF